MHEMRIEFHMGKKLFGVCALGRWTSFFTAQFRLSILREPCVNHTTPIFIHFVRIDKCIVLEAVTGCCGYWTKDYHYSYAICLETDRQNHTKNVHILRSNVFENIRTAVSLGRTIKSTGNFTCSATGYRVTLFFINSLYEHLTLMRNRNTFRNTQRIA